jgi:Uma2 family endonuclease
LEVAGRLLLGYVRARLRLAMTALPKRRFSEEEYLMIERAADYKSDFCDGEIYSMAGASERHLLLCSSIVGSLYAQFKGRPCKVYQSDMRVRVADAGMYTYPDVVAVCGQPRFLDARRDTLLNPQLLVEVLSPSTVDYDRGNKIWRYRRIESLTDYLIVAQDGVLVEHGRRNSAGQDIWTVREYAELSDRIELGSLGAGLSLSDIYERIDFQEEQFPAR